MRADVPEDSLEDRGVGPENRDAEVVAPGESTRPVGLLAYESSQDHNRGEVDPEDICDFLLGADSVVMLEVLDVEFGGGESCEDSPFSGRIWTMVHGEVFANAGGRQWPSRISVVLLTSVNHSLAGGVRAGDLWLAALREIRDHVFVMSRVLFTFTDNETIAQEAVGERAGYILPYTFSDLHAKVSAHLPPAEHRQQCAHLWREHPDYPDPITDDFLDEVFYDDDCEP